MSLIMKLQQLQGGDLEKLQGLYQNLEFPMEIRYYCAHWIEAQNWSSIDIDNPVFEPDAIDLLHGMIKQVQAKIEELSDDEMFPIKLKLNNFTQELNKRFSNQPFAFVRLINHCLESEERLVQNSMQNRTVESPQAPPCNKDITENITNIRMMTQKTEEDLSNLQQKQEMFVFQYQENLRFQGRLNQLANSLAESDPNRRAEEVSLRKKKAEVEQVLQTEAQELLRMRMDLAEKHRKTLYSLKILQSRVLEDELIRWKRQQQLAGIGGPPEGTLDQQQCWCEALAELIWHNRQQVKKVELLRQQLPIPVPHGQDLLPELNRCFMAQLSTLVTSTFIIEKQPPQVLKKETRFSASVRLLVGGKLNVHMNPPQVKATIISESQAKAVLASETSSWNETSGDILNNCGVMEYHRETGVLNVTFRNMSLKRIRRADRRGSEFVTEEKFTILFQSQFSVASGELVFQVRTMSLPVVVVSHGNQECNALATILWDNAFGESGRVPFVVPDGVPFADMGRALNSKFMLANGRSLSDANLLYLAQKAFSPDHNVGQTEDFSNVYITWSIFNRDPLPNRTFTFWRWFHGVLELTRKHLRGPWNDGSIMGFVSRSMAHDLLLSQQVGCFLLRFSDSEIGGITIAWLAEDANTGERQVYNLQPFTADDFNIRSLADRIHDLSHLTHLYPDKPKDTAFGQYYTTDPEVPPQGDGGYVPTSLVSHIPHMPGGPPQHHSQEMGNREPMSPPSQQLMTSSSLRVSSSDGMVGTTSMDQNLDPLEELPILEDYDDPQAGIMEDLLRWSASTS
ncbi:signal transducer and activator of transcription 5B isoform X2 [Strongylocentrotus purpuratus]|uniref:Signal transducer and activator of transcription n=1 Tax=Strongylocentrotus purpuratus TaxID=7668 RepID=A0A7M7LWL8_STRPU|nr:signal transducer and activator of transcription 5B isoform X2 [Strongylocentrotus purpuratus]|eukprot:XP_011681709.1 PREDICTED: signal transducer and activator of transcription 5B isoform X2 [Strongylocentrotus purpuratus]